MAKYNWGPNGETVSVNKYGEFYKGPFRVVLTPLSHGTQESIALVHINGFARNLIGKSPQHAVTLVYNYACRLFKEIGVVIDYDVED